LPHLDALVSIGNSMEHLHPAVARGRPVIRAHPTSPSKVPQTCKTLLGQTVELEGWDWRVLAQPPRACCTG